MANDVTTYHYDNERTGWNRKEKHLTPAAVAGPKFKELFRYSSGVIDDIVRAQPLYLEKVVIGQKRYNVVFVATESATIYAFDADVVHTGSNPWLWRRSLVNTAAQETASQDGGLKGTPVIHRSKRAMYVLGRLQDKNHNYFFRLHGIDFTTGLDLPGLTPQVIDSTTVLTVAGNGQPSTTPGQVYFDPQMQWNRPGLLFANHTVYAAFGSTGDNAPYHGWVLGFRARDLKLKHVFCSTPDAAGQDLQCWSDPDLGGGLWQAGFGIAGDKHGHVYCVTANGLFGSSGGGSPARNYADSLLKLAPNLKLVGSFTPPDPLALTAQDIDFGSAGTVVLPNGIGGRDFAIACGKDAIVYLVDRSELKPAHLGEVGIFRSMTRLTSNPGATAPGCGSGPGVWGGPAYYGGHLGHVIYYCGDKGPLQALVLKMNDKIYHNWQKTPGGAWAGDTTLAGRAKQIAAAINKDGRLEIFYIDPKNKTYHNWQKNAGGAWAGQTPLGGWAKQITVGSNQDGRLEVFYIGANDNIYHNWQVTPGGTWAGESVLGGTARQICVGRNQNGTLEAFYVGIDDLLYHNWQMTAGGAWAGENLLPLGPAGLRADGFTTIGAAQQITVALNKNGTLEVLYIGSDFNLYHNWQTSPSGPWYGQTNGETPLGGSAKIVTVIGNQDGRLEVFYIGTDSNLYHNWQTTPNGPAWAGESALNGWAKQIAVGANQDGRLEVFYTEKDDKIYHNWQVSAGGSWSGEKLLGGSAMQMATAPNQDGRLEVFHADGCVTLDYTSSSVPNMTATTEDFPNEGGTIPVVTSNGLKRGTGVVWAITRPDGAGMIHLRGYDAANLAKGRLFEAVIGSYNNSNAFLAPIVVNGKVYVASDQQLTVYGLK
jgi:hypothetical protein